MLGWFSYPSLYLLLAVYAVMYSPVFKFGNIGLIKPLLVIGLPFAIGRFFWLRKSQSINLLLLFVTLALTIIFCNLIALSQGGDTTFHSLLMAIFLGLLPLGWVVVTLQPKGFYSIFERLITAIALVGFLQAFTVLLAGLWPEFDVWTAGFLIQPTSIEGTHRVTGISSLAGDGLSFSLSISAISSIYLFFTRKYSKPYCFAAVCGVILVAMMFTARTGYFIFGVFLLVYLLRNRSIANFWKLCEFILYLCLGGYFIFLLANETAQNKVIDVLLPYTFEYVYNFVDRGELTTASSDELMSMWIWPQADIQWLFGDGYFAHPTIEGSNYVPSDIGYVRMIFYVGLIGSALYYGMLCIFAHFMVYKTRSNEAAAVVVGFFVVSFIAHIKFPFLLQSQFLGVLFLLLFALLHDARFQRQNRTGQQLTNQSCSL